MTATLMAHAKRLSTSKLQDLAAARTDLAPLTAAGWSANFMRAHLDSDAEAALMEFAAEKDLSGAIEALFKAHVVNPSEVRPALHWALRAPLESISGEARTVRQSLEAAYAFASDPATQNRFTSIVHIGIGGSDFGPRLIYDAFADKNDNGTEVRFCANVDPLDLNRAFDGLDVGRTLVIGVSKSFGTEETLYNLNRARERLGKNADGQIALVTANRTRAEEWAGETGVHIFDMPLSVGGRFSLWSAASLSCMIALGADTFREIAAGAHAMDEHTQTAALEDNVPACLALLDYWNATCRGQPMRVLLAYANRLRLLPTYLQQLEMESNGKSVGWMGDAVPAPTAPALWGGEGSVGQHSYHQWLHQGSHAVPTEFILAPDAGADAEGVRALTAHALAQAEVLCNGRTADDIRRDEPDLVDAVVQQKVHAGGRPSTFLTHENFGPHAFGALIAMYEHRTYLAGRLWGLNPFDQWGVERGKVMAGQLKDALSGGPKAADAVTAALIKQVKG